MGGFHHKANLIQYPEIKFTQIPFKNKPLKKWEPDEKGDVKKIEEITRNTKEIVKKV